MSIEALDALRIMLDPAGQAAIAAVWGIWHLVAGGLIVGDFRLFDLRRGEA